MSKLLAGLGLSVSAIRSDRHRPQLASVGLLLDGRIEGQEALEKARPNLDAFQYSRRRA